MNDNSFQITGTVHHIGKVQTFPSGFSKREFVLLIEDGKYPQTVPFELVKDKVDLIANFREGDRVDVSFNLRGNHHEKSGRYFGSNAAWKIAGSNAQQDRREQDPGRRAPDPGRRVESEMDLGEDDIPFN